MTNIDQESTVLSKPQPSPLTFIGPFIGVVHIPALPGDPRAPVGESFSAVYKRALADADALVEGGVDGLIVENFGSAPFYKGDSAHRIPPHQTAAITSIGAEIKHRHPQVAIGINCLRNDAYTALGIAAAIGAQFIRVNIHTGAYLTDQGVIEGEAVQTLSYRRALGANQVQIWADVLVKHATPLAPISAEQASADTLKRGHADALIVTGTGTGAQVNLELLKTVGAQMGESPLYIGSGLTLENASRYAQYASGAIVGTSLKVGGALNAPVCSDRTRALREVLNQAWAPSHP